MRPVLALLALLAAAPAFAQGGGLKGTGAYGTAGCGLGSLVFGNQAGAVQILAATTNGTFASQTLLDSSDPISRLRGRFHDYHGIPLMPTFHPAFLLRSPEKKREVWEDLKKVMQLMLK